MPLRHQHAMAAFIDIALQENAEIVTPVVAEAWPADRAARRVPADHRCRLRRGEEGLRRPFSRLHGAMVSEDTDDGEGTLLERVRRLAPQLPIAVALDLHTNLTRKIVENCTILRVQDIPHVDMYDAGARAGRILIRALRGEVSRSAPGESSPAPAHPSHGHARAP